MNREIIPKLKIIIGEAVKEARLMDDTLVKPEHILISIINDNDNACSDTLKSLGLNLVLLNDCLILEVRNSNLTPRIDNSTKVTVPFSKESKLLFKAVDFESKSLGDNHIDTTHIMMAMLNTNNKLNIRKLLKKISFEELPIFQKKLAPKVKIFQYLITNNQFHYE